MAGSESEAEWASDEFGDTNLFNSLRTQRLVRVAAQVAGKPAGKITQVMAEDHDRQGAYGLLASSAASWPQAARAAARAAFGRASGGYVLVPVDGSSLSLPGAPIDSDFGPVGNSNSNSIGVEVMSAIVLDVSGGVLGAAAQHFWTRPLPRAQPRVAADIAGRATRLPRKRSLSEKETAYWLRCCEDAMSDATQAGYAGKLWFQLDRGGDAHEVLSWSTGADCWVTIRAAQDRKVLFEPAPKLWEAVESRPAVGEYTLEVPAGHTRAARSATMRVRIGEVTLALRQRGGATTPGPFVAVLATEVSAVPAGEEPIEWLLLTTRPGTTFADAMACIAGYATRWRIEDAHKTWKSVTKVEESNLRSAERVILWAVILWSVALRIERLKHLARTQPDLPALAEFTAPELTAIAKLKKAARPKFVMPADLTIRRAVTLIAELGGFTGERNSGGPPGSITIARGLRRVRELAAVLTADPALP
jgi:hypothetical protein